MINSRTNKEARKEAFDKGKKKSQTDYNIVNNKETGYKEWRKKERNASDIFRSKNHSFKDFVKENNIDWGNRHNQGENKNED